MRTPAAACIEAAVALVLLPIISACDVCVGAPGRPQPGCFDGGNATAVQLALDEATRAATGAPRGVLCFAGGTISCSNSADGYEARLGAGAHLELRGGDATTTVDCDGRARAFVLRYAGAAGGAPASVAIVGMRFVGGRAEAGGAVLASGVSLAVSDCSFHHCVASSESAMRGGGAVFVDAEGEGTPPPSLSVAVTGSTFVGCSAQKLGGAVGVLLPGPCDACDVQLTNVTCSECSAFAGGCAAAVVAGGGSFAGSSRFRVIKLRARACTASFGGALRFQSGRLGGDAELELRDSAAERCVADGDGGGVSVRIAGDVTAGAVLALRDVTFDRCEARRGSGGGLDMNAMLLSGQAQVIVDGSVFRQCAAARGTSAGGGGASVAIQGMDGGAAFAVRRTVFDGCSAAGSQRGGGLYFGSGQLAGQSTWSLSHTVFRNCSARSGGAVSVTVGGQLLQHHAASIRASVFVGSRAQGTGGSVLYSAGGAADDATWAVTSSVFSDSQAALGAGGALHVDFSSGMSGSARSSIDGCTFSGCAALTGGGAVYFDLDDGVLGGQAAWRVQRVAFAGCGLHRVPADAFDGPDACIFAGTCQGGGALYFHSAQPAAADEPGALRITNVSCARCTAAEGSGGCVFLSNHLRNVRLERVAASHVSADAYGGFLFAGTDDLAVPPAPVPSPPLPFELSDLFVADASAAEGAGIALVAVPVTPFRLLAAPQPLWLVRLEDAAFTRLRATVQGGCLFVQSRSARFNADASPPPFPVFHFVHVSARRVRAADVAVTGDSGALLSASGARVTLDGVVARTLSARVGGAAASIGDGAHVALANAEMAELRGVVGALLLSKAFDVSFDLAGVVAEVLPPPQQQEQQGSGAGAPWPAASSVFSLAGVRSAAIDGRTAVTCPSGTVASNASSAGLVMAATDTHFCDFDAPECEDFPQDARFRAALQPAFSWQLACLPCPPGQYSLGRPVLAAASNASAAAFASLRAMEDVRARACRPCPFGAVCSGGDDVRPTVGHWGAPSPAAAAAGLLPDPFVVLPHGYGCASAAECARGPGACHGQRAGTACGRCAAGFAEALGSAACVPASRCGAPWATLVALPLLMVATVTIAVVGVRPCRTSGGARPVAVAAPDADDAPPLSQLLTIVLSFLQLCGMARVSGVSRGDALVRAVSEWAGLQPSFVEPQGSGVDEPSAWAVCFSAAATAMDLRVAQIALALALVALVGLVQLVHAALWRTGLPHISLPVRSHYARAAALIASLVYGQIAANAVQLITPLLVSAHGARLAIDGTQPWMGTPGQVAALAFFLICVAPAPWGMWRAMTLVRERSSVGPWMVTVYILAAPLAEAMHRCHSKAARTASPGATPAECGDPDRPAVSAASAAAVLQPLCSAARDACFWWGAVYVARRLLFASLRVALTSVPQLHQLALCAAAFAFALHHATLRPFRHVSAHALESLSGACLVVFTVVQVYYATLRVAAARDTRHALLDEFAVIEALALAAPALCFCVLLTGRVRALAQQGARRWHAGRRGGALQLNPLNDAQQQGP